MSTWYCSACGKRHSSAPTSFSWERPYDYYTLPTERRSTFVAMGKDLCHIDDEFHFLRSNLQLKIQGTDSSLLLGVWAGVSRENFYRYRDFLANEAIEPDPPPLHGAFCGVLPGYDPDQLLWSEIRVHIRRGGLVPEVLVDNPSHPLFEAQANGVTQDYWHQFVHELMPEVAANFGL